MLRSFDLQSSVGPRFILGYYSIYKFGCIPTFFTAWLMFGITNYSLSENPDHPVIHRIVGQSSAGECVAPPLSIKCMFGGSARYVTDARQHHVVDDSGFLLLNKGHNYEFEKCSAVPIETFCIFFPADLVPTVAHQCVLSDEKCLESELKHFKEFNHYEYRRPHLGVTSQRILRIRDSLLLKRLDEASLEQELILLAFDLVLENKNIEKKIAQLPYAKYKTRSELFRRINVARDHIHAHHSEPFSLSNTARIASMSSFHFLRAFRQVVGETPLTYLQRIRLQQATGLLRKTKLPISEIAFRVGYQSLASFSTLFKKHYQVPPSKYRRMTN